MKKILIYLIRGYQAIPFIGHKMCRFTPSCSEYMAQAIDQYGSLKGIKLGIKRLLKCHPFGKYGYDPVPNKKEENIENI